MVFVLNPYDADLDLTDKDDRKLYNDGCKGLKETGDHFDGKKKNFKNWSKLMEPLLKKTRSMICFMVPTMWDDTPGNTAAARTARRMPIEDKMVNIFKTHRIDREKVVEYSDLVWANTGFGNNTPKYFARLDPVPTSDDTLDDVRDQRKLKHVILGQKIWSSLTSDFQLELSTKKDEYSREDEFDGPLLWDTIRRHVNPSTTVGASKFKEEIEKVTLADFDHDVQKFNTWFEDMRNEIIKEEGEGKYNEYLRQLFRAYETSENKQFIDAIAEEKRKWHQGRLSVNYDYGDLLDLGRLTYVNLDVDQEKKKKTKEKKGEEEGQAKFLALATSILQSLKGTNASNKGGSGQSNKSSDGTVYKD